MRVLRHREPPGVSDVQRAHGLSSSSVSEYHLGKLVKMGLIKEEQGGYVVDKVVVENVVRIRIVSIPKQAAYSIFFGVSLVFLLAFLRPETLSTLYFYALAICLAALGISLYETERTWNKL